MEALGRSKAVPLHIKTFGLQKKKKGGGFKWERNFRNWLNRRKL